MIWNSTVPFIILSTCLATTLSLSLSRLQVRNRRLLRNILTHTHPLFGRKSCGTHLSWRPTRKQLILLSPRLPCSGTFQRHYHTCAPCIPTSLCWKYNVHCVIPGQKQNAWSENLKKDRRCKDYWKTRSENGNLLTDPEANPTTQCIYVLAKANLQKLVRYGDNLETIRHNHLIMNSLPA